MTADYFYESFRDALSYLLVPWGSKEDVIVYLRNDELVFEYQGRTASMKIPQQKKNT